MLISSVLVTFLSFVIISSSLQITFAQSNISGVVIENENIQQDPLPSWADNQLKQKIIEFIENITNPQKAEYYIAPEDRIAVFDNDGTLWSEKPIPFQAFFSMDRVPNVISKNPALKEKYPFKEILAKNFSALKDITQNELMTLLVSTHSNMSQIEFDSLVNKWILNATHPQTKMLFVDMVYQPMLELLNFLRANQFKEFIVSGGGIDFIRSALSSVYDIPEYQIIGSSLKYKYVDNINWTNSYINNNKSYIFKAPKIISLNDKYEKPANIALHIGKIPVIAVGNSDGDFQMLKYTDDNNDIRKSLEIIVHHDDPVREFMYDSHAESVLDEAKKRNWSIVSMKNDFIDIYPSHNDK